MLSVVCITGASGSITAIAPGICRSSTAEAAAVSRSGGGNHASVKPAERR
ncbi:hypothetical protein [Actinomadura madurae]|nr:hypothetical protein [Actinomadura madurae]MCP9982499.1 hypothetical protein [Actinomadura madurae]MCQ0005965.1 hypothetical protein [Actinomadura madurae]MCQ0018746.1 hypothetical protein [Actinomadura madurae]